MYSGRATARSASDMEVVGAGRNQPRERVQEGGGADGGGRGRGGEGGQHVNGDGIEEASRRVGVKWYGHWYIKDF